MQFAPNSALATKLLATGTRQLVESNTRGDTYWCALCAAAATEDLAKRIAARGFSFTSAMRTAARRGFSTDGAGGENKLGQLLMQRRDELRALASAAAAPPPTPQPPPLSVAAEPAGGADADTQLGKRRSDDAALSPSKHAKPDEAEAGVVPAHNVSVIE
jgi:hypothetical protein